MFEKRIGLSVNLLNKTFDAADIFLACDIPVGILTLISVRPLLVFHSTVNTQKIRAAKKKKKNDIKTSVLSISLEKTFLLGVLF